MLGCPGGERLARRTGEASRSDQVIHQLGVAATRLRADLGEQEASFKTYDMPLERATTPIPAALLPDAKRKMAREFATTAGAELKHGAK